jgi:NAD(P)-dependent dehydrogenase (short-subunit alcohol dehydrogenase family)
VNNSLVLLTGATGYVGRRLVKRLESLGIVSLASGAGSGGRHRLAPRMVRTPLTARLTAHEASVKASVAMHPLGRIGEPSDVAAVMTLLLGPGQSRITGPVFRIDGGLSTLRMRGKS